MAYFDGTNAPTISLEMKLVTTWTAVTITDVKSISVRRGRTREDQNYQPGTLTVTFDNISGKYNPENQSSPYFVGGRTYLDTHTAIRLKAIWNSVSYTLYDGYIEDVQVDVSLAPVTTIIATDALAFFARTKLALPALTGTQTVQNRINTILGNFNVSYTAKDIGTGARNVVVQDETLDVLSLLEEAAACEFGRFWINREGTAYFRSWDALPTMPFGIDLTDFHDLTTVEYDVINVEPGSRYRINSVTVDGNNSSTATGSDTDSTSVSAYGLYAKQYSLPLSTNADCAALAAQIVGRFANPFTRVNHVEFEGVGMGSLWEKILPLDLNYLVNVDRTTVDDFVFQIGGFVEGLNFDITPESWRYSLELSDYAYSVFYWISAYNTESQARAIDIDQASNSFIAGRLFATAPYAMFIAKYDNQRNMLWQRELYNDSSAMATDIVIDNAGDAIVIGLAGNGSTYDVTVAKYDTSGGLKWQRKISAANPNLTDNSYWAKAATDSSNNIYVAGVKDTNSAIFLIKYDANGSVLWQRKLTSSVVVPQVTTDSSGNVYVSCYTSNTIHLVKYNSSGSLQWKKDLTKSATNPIPYGGLKVDSSGNIYLGFTKASTYQDASIVKFDSTGAILWQNEITATAGYGNSYGISINSNDEIYWIGENGSVPFIINLDSTGAILWQNTFSSSAYVNRLSDVRASNNSIHLTGYNGDSNSVAYTFTDKLPTVGTLTGTYSVPTTYGTLSFTYATSTFALTATSYTSGTSSLTDAAGDITETAGSLTDVSTAYTITGLDLN